MAKIDIIVDLDLNKNQLLNAALQSLAVHPSTTGLPVGYIYWNTAANSGGGTAYVWTGSASTPNTDSGWLDLGQAYTHPTYPGTGQPASALTGANVISRILLENGHVTGVTTRAMTAADIGAAGSSHTHNFADIIGLPTQTILGNNTGTTGPAKALTVSDLMAMMSIGYGSLALLNAGTDTTQRTQSPKDLNDWLTAKLGGYITAVNLALGTRTSTTMPITNSAGTGVTLPIATTALAGLMSGADKTKLDGIATGANNYVHPTVNPGAHPFATELTSGVLVLSQMVVNNEGHVTTIKGRNLTAADVAAIMINDAINNGTTQTWSSSKIFTEIQNAITQAGTGALIYKGEYNPVTNTPNVGLPATGVKTGWTYVVSVDGTFLGEDVEVGDMIIAKVDNPGTTRANWQIVNKNIPAIVAASTTVAGIIMIATTAEALAGTNNTKAITALTLKAVLDARLGSFAANIGDGSTLTYTVTHGLNTTDVQVDLQRVSDKKFVLADVAAPSATTVTVAFNTAPATGAYRVLISKI
jgi:hypothetical protein